ARAAIATDRAEDRCFKSSSLTVSDPVRVKHLAPGMPGETRRSFGCGTAWNRMPRRKARRRSDGGHGACPGRVDRAEERKMSIAEKNRKSWRKSLQAAAVLAAAVASGGMTQCV